MPGPYGGDVGTRHCLARLAVRSDGFRWGCKEFQEFPFSVRPLRNFLFNQGVGKVSDRSSQLRGKGHHGSSGQGAIDAVIIIGKYRGYWGTQDIFHLTIREKWLLGDAIEKNRELAVEIDFLQELKLFASQVEG